MMNHTPVAISRSICNSVSLHDIKDNASIKISKSVIVEIITKFSNIISKIFTNCLMQCRQNTVVSLMGSIQHCILCTVCTLAGFFTNLQAMLSCSNGTTYAKKNVRCNHHDNLAQVRKSEKSLQYSHMRIKVVDLTCTITLITSITENNINNANTNNVWKRKPFFYQNFRNYSTNKICYLLCAISLSPMPNFYLQKYFLQKVSSLMIMNHLTIYNTQTNSLIIQT